MRQLSWLLAVWVAGLCSAHAAEFAVNKDSRIELVYVAAPDCVYCRSWRYMSGGWSSFVQTEPGKAVELVTVNKGAVRNRMKREYFDAQYAFLFDRDPAFGNTVPAWWLLVDGVPVTRRTGEDAWKRALEPVVEKFARAKLTGGATVSYTPVQKSVGTPPTSIDDVEHVPYLSGAAKESYRRFLKLGSPRAFALSADGSYGWRSGGTDPAAVALRDCNANAADFPCKLYVLDEKLVFTLE